MAITHREHEKELAQRAAWLVEICGVLTPEQAVVCITAVLAMWELIDSLGYQTTEQEVVYFLKQVNSLRAAGHRGEAEMLLEAAARGEQTGEWATVLRAYLERKKGETRDR